MATRNAARGAAGPGKTELRAPARADDSRNLNESLAALETHRRDTLLEAVAEAARELLRSSELGVSLQKVIERIGVAAGVDRTHIFKIDNSAGDGRIVQHHLWTLPGVPTPADFQHISRPMAEVGLESWIPRLDRGETIFGHSRDFAPEARALLESGNIKSTLCVPVFAEGRWVGIIAFDDCRSRARLAAGGNRHDQDARRADRRRDRAHRASQGIGRCQSDHREQLHNSVSHRAAASRSR